MDQAFDTQWSAGAWLTFSRLPADVQAGLTTLLKQLVTQYRGYYHQLADERKALSTMPHIHVPEWNIWLRMQAHYQEDEIGPIVFIYGLEELSYHEFDYSLNESRQIAHRLNPAE